MQERWWPWKGDDGRRGLCGKGVFDFGLSICGAIVGSYISWSEGSGGLFEPFLSAVITYKASKGIASGVR